MVRQLSNRVPMQWGVFATGALLFVSSAVWMMADGELVVVDFIKISVPLAVSIGLVVAGLRFRHELQDQYVARVTVWILGGLAVGVLINLWFVFIILLESSPTGEPVILNLNGAAIMMGLAAVIGYSRVQLQRTSDKLNRQNERLDEFASVVSHDLRNPLNVATGRLELARTETDNDHIDSAARALNRMEALIEKMQVLGQAGEPIEGKTAVELSDVVESAWESTATENASLVVESESVLEADRDRLQQLLENLFRNAVEHGNPDVTIRVGDHPDGFYVEDDGPGIPADDRELIFEKGYSSSRDGLGYGLYIVKEIAEAHDWRVELSSGTDGGARFIFSDL